MIVKGVIILLSNRYEYDEIPAMHLNMLQVQMIKQIKYKVDSNNYPFEEVPCLICGGYEFERLAEKDRYGLYMSTVICKDCGLIQTNPRMNQKSYNEFYNTEYRKLYVGSSLPTESFFKEQYYRGESIYQYLEQKLGFEIANLNIIEVGVGAGGILQYFKEKQNNVYGCDLGSEYTHFGKEKYGLNLHIGSVHELDIDFTPDIVIYSHVLEHILNPIEELTKLKSICGPNTYLYIEVPGVKNLKNSYNQDFLKYLQNAHVYHFTLTTLRNVLECAGYEFVVGDERIRSIFKNQKYSNIKKEYCYDNDYNKALSFLKKMDIYRHFSVVFHLKYISMSLSIKLLKHIGLYPKIKKIFR